MSFFSNFLQVQVGGSFPYVVDKKLGKGGFGQVYLGNRLAPTKDTLGANANQARNLPPLLLLLLLIIIFLPS